MAKFCGSQGRKFNLDQVRKIEEWVRGADHFVEVTWQDGEVEAFHENTPKDRGMFKDLRAVSEEWVHYVVPSAPGFELVRWYPPRDDEEEWICRSPVIAWDVSDTNLRGGGDCDNVAISICDVSTTSLTAVICPQGYVKAFDYALTWESEGAWLEFVRKEWHGAKQQEAAE